MRLLFITDHVPYPPTDGWRIRVHAFLRGLAPRHEITLVSFSRMGEDGEAAAALRDLGVRVHVIPRNPRYSPLKLARGLVGRTAFPILNYYDERMTAALAQVAATASFDLVQAESLHTAQYCGALSTPVVLDLHNIESLLMKRYARRTRHPLKRFYAEVTWRKLAAYERRVCPSLSHCLTCSDEDRVLLQTACGVEQVSVVPNGVDVRGYVPEQTTMNGAARPDAPRIVFVGRMDYHANVDAVQWFCRDVFPRVRRARPDVLLQIVGGHPTGAVRRLASPGTVEVTGFVSDVRPYLLDASAVVVPLRIGGGTRLKILEALAMGKAVISTALGAEGLEAMGGRDLLIANPAEQFADEVIAVLSDPDLRARLGAAGRRLAVETYDWSGIVQKLEQVYETCLAPAGAMRQWAPSVEVHQVRA
jgi:sugar transferase (PEP-CTERM/EpsH1 system associated)